MTNSLPPQPSYQPTPGLVTSTWHTPGQAPAATTTVFAHPAAVIPVLADDHHQAIDWPRVRRAVRACLTPATVTGLALSPLWARFALPLAEGRGLGAVVGLGFMAAVYTGIARGLGYSPRALVVVVLVAVGAGTIELIPATIAHHLMES